MKNKHQKKEWRRYVAKLFPNTQTKERMRQEIKAIDNRMHQPSANNEWRVLQLIEGRPDNS